MKLYRLSTGEGYHAGYATAKHLSRAKRVLDMAYEDDEDYKLEIERIDFELSKRGILEALWEGCEAAGGHESGLMLWADEAPLGIKA